MVMISVGRVTKWLVTPYVNNTLITLNNMDNVQNLLINNICSVINLPGGLLNSGRKAGLRSYPEHSTSPDS